MPKTFQFGRKRRHAKARGTSLIKKRKVSENSSMDVVENAPSNSTSSPANNNRDHSDESGPSTSTLQSDNPSSSNRTRVESKLSAYDLLDVDDQSHSSGGNFHLIHTTFLQSLISSLSCPYCLDSCLTIEASSKVGMAINFNVSCQTCQVVVFSDVTSPMGPKRYDINNRIVLSAKENGMGYKKLVSFFSLLNAPSPMSLSTFHEISLDIHKAATDAAESVMVRASNFVEDKYDSESTSTRHSSTGCPVTTVSFDGTWQKRGHSSHNGVGVVIDVDTGLVLDTHTVTNICMACEKGPIQGSENYEQWYVQHKDKCMKNSKCSSNGMEVVAAEELFKRSVKERGLIYGDILCDGDSKAFHKVKDTAGYDVDIRKIDCINHIAKRMFNGLENVKKSNKNELNRKLTRPMIDKITNTYAKNLKDNAPNAVDMKNGVIGGILHMCSTDDKPNHRHCPAGEASWCAYQRAVATMSEIPPHRPTFKPQILKFIWPTVLRLTEPELLQRCSQMLTQNANESFNAPIWKRCPKIYFANRLTVETATALATISFKCGPFGMRLVMSRLGLRWEKVNHDFASFTLKDKVNRAANKTVSMSKWKRKLRKSQRLVTEHEMETAEGSTYIKGGFNA